MRNPDSSKSFASNVIDLVRLGFAAGVGFAVVD
jgi:hypothetical protein